MEITADNFQNIITAAIKQRVAFNAQNCDKIGQRIGADISGRIISGEAKPDSLKINPGYYTTKKGYKVYPKMAQGAQTLYETGDYAAKFTVEFVSEDEAWLVNKSGKSPQWRNLRERSQSVVNKETLKTILQEELR